MHRARWPRLLTALAACFVGIACAHAVEPVDDMLQELRHRRMYDTAIDYLESLAASPGADAALRERLVYEQAVTLTEAAAQTKDTVSRDSQLARADALFEKFLKESPGNALAGSAQIQRANLLVERGRAELAAAKAAGGAADKVDNARKLFGKAEGGFEAAEKQLSAELAKMPKLVDPADTVAAARKRQLSSDVAQVRMLRPTIDCELAASYEHGSAAAKKHLVAAAKSYAALVEAYRTRPAGLLARMYEGRCYQEMGEIQRALGCFRQLMDLEAADETRAIKTKGTRYGLECLTDESQKKYQEAIERGERWEKESATAASDADALAIRYLTAVAYQGQSSSLPAKDPNRKKLAGVARQRVGPVASQPGEFQRPARMLLVALGGNKEVKRGAAKTTFADAFEQAKQSLEKMQLVEAELKAARDKGDKAAAEALERQKRENSDAARQSLELALAVADAKIAADDLNSARYYLCYLHWDAGELYDAAVIGDFLARRYPDSPAGRQGARIALAAYVRMYGESRDAEKTFEARQIEAIADLIFKQWPDGGEADEAALSLVNFYTTSNQGAKAVELLKKIPETSPRRGQAELRAGQALWSAYLRRSQAPAAERPPQAELDQLKKQAQEVLEQGVARMEKADKIDPTLVAAVFALAQICVDTGQPDKAIEWLENPKVGPLTLIAAKNPAVARESFVIEANKLALRAYIAVNPQQLKKAEQVMDSLEKLVQGAGDAKAAENLTAIYISLGRELQQHLQDLRKSGQTKQLDAVTQAFEVFLDRVIKRDTGNNYASLNWVAETYASLGGGFDDGADEVSSRAADYFQKAATAYGRLLEMAEKDPKFKDNPDSLVAVRLRLADCDRRAGKFDDAIKALEAVLKAKPNLLSAQVQAAETYQAQGALDPVGFRRSIGGGAPGKDGKNLVWGWAKISKMTMTNPKFADVFHQSRLSLSEARRRAALAEKDAALRAKILDAAKQDLWFTYKLQPDLGGEETTARYDRLLRQVQKDLGMPETGLQEFRDRDKEPAAGAATNSAAKS